MNDSSLQKEAFRAGEFWCLDDWFNQLVVNRQFVQIAEFANAMNWAPSAVEIALKKNRLFCIEKEHGQFFPLFYASPDYDLTQLQTLTENLGKIPGESKLYFFTGRKISLNDDSPLQALARGHYDEVLQALRIYTGI